MSGEGESPDGRDDSAWLDRALDAVGCSDLDRVVLELEGWTAADGGPSVFKVVGRRAVEAIEEDGRVLGRSPLPDRVADSASWIPEIDAEIVDVIVRGLTGEPAAVAGLSAKGVSLVCLLIISWGEETPS